MTIIAKAFLEMPRRFSEKRLMSFVSQHVLALVELSPFITKASDIVIMEIEYKDHAADPGWDFKHSLRLYALPIDINAVQSSVRDALERIKLQNYNIEQLTRVEISIGMQF